MLELRTNQLNFYPRPPRGGRPDYRLQDNDYSKFLSTPSGGWGTNLNMLPCVQFFFSIHARRAEGDFCCASDSLASRISIHALREEGDGLHTLSSHQRFYFYPRPPRGGRHATQIPAFLS